VWNNVNSCFYHNEALLKTETIKSMTPLVKLFHDYGVRSFLSPCYESPQLDLKTADPRNNEVKAWWAKKAGELKTEWPEGAFGGFMFKADSEGQPGPKAYNVPEIQGANLMAKALDTVGAIVIWRAFSHPGRGDVDQYLYQAKRFSQWEGKARDNVVLQLKYGAGDFQSTEPVHALFGKLPSVNKIMEIQATQEYTGQAKHLANLVPMWKNVLDFDTYANGQGSTVAKVLTGHTKKNPSQRIFTGMAAVSNIGDDKTWTGHPMSAANTYGAGRLAWDPSLSGTDITKEWIDLTFGKNDRVEKTLLPMMMRSLDVWENFTSPMGWGWHVGKAKVFGTQHYYMDLSAHNYQFMRANKESIGVPRTCTPKGECYNNYYNSPIKGVYGDVDKCPDKLLLHFHTVNYDHKLHDGRKVGDAIYQGYEHGAAESAKFVDEWDELKDVIDTKSTGMTFAEIKEKLHQAASDARGFAKNGTEWFETTRSGGTPPSFVRDMNKAANMKKKHNLKVGWAR
jgi:alpha-glucuronidase